MPDMDKDTKFTIRISTGERAKIAECAAFTGVSSGEFVRRAINVMLMVMGDKDSERRIRGILKEATGIMKVGAGRQPVPPSRSHRYPPAHPKAGRKARESGST